MIYDMWQDIGHGKDHDTQNEMQKNMLGGLFISRAPRLV